MNVLSLLSLTSQVIVALFSVILLRKYSNSFARILCAVLLTNAIAEMIGLYCDQYQIDAFYSYYVYTITAFVLIGLMYLKSIKNIYWKNVVKILLSLFIIFFVVVYFKRDFFIVLVIFGGFNTSVFIFAYLKELLQSNEIVNYKNLLPFWVSVGMLVFYLPSIPFFTMYKYMENRGLFFVLNILIILMNIIISYGLICSKEEKY